KISQHKFLDVKTYQEAQLQYASFCREHEIAMLTIDDDEIALCVEPGSPLLSRRPFEGIARKSARVDHRLGHGGLNTGGDRYQGLRSASDLALCNRYLQACEAGRIGRQILDFLVGRARK